MNKDLNSALDRFRQQNERWQSLVAPLSERQRHWKPGPKKWSIAEVADHLIRTGEPYLSRLSTSRSRANRASQGMSYKPTMIGGYLIKAVEPGTKPVPAPGAFRPGVDGARSGVFSELERINAALEQEYQAWEDLDLNAPRFGSPATSLIRMKPGDALMLLAPHMHRHVDQMERVIQSPGFPVE